MIGLQIRGLTDKGKVRETNQDSFYIEETAKWCIIADGMGGHNGGEIASKTTVDVIKENLNCKPTNIDACLKNAIYTANKNVYDMSLHNENLVGMGTTGVVCYFECRTATIANVGDSRAYHLGELGLRQVTTDHSIVQQLVDLGKITPHEAKTHPQKNLITRAIGTEPNIEVDITHTVFKKGDYFLLCTDGLTTFVDDEIIAQVIKNNDIDNAVKELVNLANENGGMDNITVVLILI